MDINLIVLSLFCNPSFPYKKRTKRIIKNKLWFSPSNLKMLTLMLCKFTIQARIVYLLRLYTSSSWSLKSNLYIMLKLMNMDMTPIKQSYFIKKLFFLPLHKSKLTWQTNGNSVLHGTSFHKFCRDRIYISTQSSPGDASAGSPGNHLKEYFSALLPSTHWKSFSFFRSFRPWEIKINHDRNCSLKG